MSDLNFCCQLPKVELHAHLNGSVRDSTIYDLLNGSLDENSRYVIENGECRNLSECFEMFQLIHQACGKIGIVERISQEMVEDCAADGIVYLEMRTTPKKMGTKVAYMEAVFRGITEARRKPKCGVGVLLSIDRGNDDAISALDTIKLAQNLREVGRPVVGIDFSGNPSQGDIQEFIPVLKFAQKLGLKISIHLAEVREKSDEILQLLEADVIPDRIGHGVFLGSSEREKIRLLGIPIEMCLTSNVKTQSCRTYTDHHMRDWLHQGHPICLCTDDSGVFGTRLSQECQLAMEFLGVCQNDLVRIQRDSAQMAFCSDVIKNEIISLVNTFSQKTE